MIETYSYTSMLYSRDHASLSRCCIAGFKWLLESQTRLLSIFCGILFLVIVLNGTYNRYLNPLRHFPGPFWASVTDLYKLFYLYSSDLTSISLKQHKKYGKTLPPSCQTEVAAEIILTSD